MATLNPQYVNLDAYERALVQQRANRVSPLDAALQGLQQGIQIQQLPQKMQDQELARQLNNALLSQKLSDLQNPNAALTRELQKIAITEAVKNPQSGIFQAPAGTVGEVIATPQAIPQTAIGLQQAVDANPDMVIPTAAPTLPIAPLGVGGVQTGLVQDLNVPAQADEDKFQRDLKKKIAGQRGATALHFTRIGNELVGLDPVSGEKIKSFAVDPTQKTINTKKGIWVYEEGDPEGGHYLEGTEPSAAASDMTPAQKITAKREVRATYDELPSKIDFFGKGQVPGSNQLKVRLDAVLKPVKGDFSKLNPQAKQTFVFAINKLRDPTSATLLAEAQQIADRAGIGARFNSFIANYKEGDPLPDQVAKDIYDVISQVESAHRENLITELIELKNDTDALGVNLTSIGVPKSIQTEVEKRIANPAPSLTPPPASSTPKAQPTRLASPVNFQSEIEARMAGFKNGDAVIIGGETGILE